MDKSFLAPDGQQFQASGLSNAKTSRDIVHLLGIDDFAVFSPYIHYYSSPAALGAVNPAPVPVTIDYRVDYTQPLPSGLP